MQTHNAVDTPNALLLEEANLHNLKTLWHAYGSKLVHTQNGLTLWQNTGWPHRAWFDISEPHPSPNTARNSNGELVAAIQQLPKGTVLPLYPRLLHISPVAAALAKYTFNGPAFMQQAMVLALENFKPNTKGYPRELSFKTVTTQPSLNAWCAVASAAFGYKVATANAQLLLKQPNALLVLAYKNSVPVATALVLLTGHTAGIHQVGVLPTQQGQGWAKAIMQFVLSYAVQQKARHAVLQASAAGEPLYKQLGFNAQFLIKNAVLS